MISPNKRKVDETAQALIGQLRLPFTGPGILTGAEYDRLMEKVIGDPTSLTSPKSTSMAQIEHLQNLLGNMQIAQLEASGVQLNMNSREVRDQLKIANLIKSQLKQNVDPATIEKAIKKLKESGGLGN